MLIQQLVLEKLDVFMQRMKLEPYFSLYLKINFNQIKDFNVRPNAIKILHEKKFHSIGFGNDFFDMISKAQTTEVQK